MVRNRSWPAVSQICSFTFLPLSSVIVLILKSMLRGEREAGATRHARAAPNAPGGSSARARAGPRDARADSPGKRENRTDPIVVMNDVEN